LLRLMNGESISAAPSAEADDDHEAVDLDACGAADVAADVAAPAPSASAKEAARIAAGKRAGDRRPVAPPGLPIPRGRVPFARPADNPLPRATPEPAPAPLTVPLTAQPSAASAARAAARLEQRDVAADSRKLLDSARASAGSAAFRAMAAARATLPAAEARAALLALLREHQVVVVSGETGCGKTTQASRVAPLGRQGRGAAHEGGGGGGGGSVSAGCGRGADAAGAAGSQVPQFLLDDCIERMEGGACSIICTQPRCAPTALAPSSRPTAIRRSFHVTRLAATAAELRRSAGWRR
jgi:hypothetical protein